MGLSKTDSKDTRDSSVRHASPVLRGDKRLRSAFSAFVRKYRLDLFAVLWAPYALLVYRFWYVTDDAFISFRYARNFALGCGLRYNPGDHTPVEGYSNFLWVMICSIFEFLRMDVTRWALLISAACGTMLLFLVFDLLRRRLELHLGVVCLATLSLGCFPPFALWSTSGLETMPFALLVFVTFERLVLRRAGPDGVGAGLAGLLLALMRVEGIAWAAVILILALLSRRIARQPALRPFVTFVLIVGVGYVVYFACRYAYYQMPLPNTVYAKADINAPRLIRGVNYVVSHALTFLTPMLIIPGSLVALRKKRLAVGLPIAGMTWAFPAYSVIVTGDFMTMARFLIPAFAFTTVLFAWLLQDLWGRGWTGRAVGSVLAVVGIVIALLPGWNRHAVPEAVRKEFDFRHHAKRFDSEYDRWRAQVNNVVEWSERGKALRSYVAQRRLPDEDPSYVTGALGAIGYYADLFVFDRHGLVAAKVARRRIAPDERLRPPGHDKQVPAEFFLEEKPTILLATVVQHADARVVVNTCRRWAEALRRSSSGLRLDRRYVIDFARVPTDDSNGRPRYIVTWTRIPEDTSPREAWDDFERRLDALRRNGHIPLPR